MSNELPKVRIELGPSSVYTRVYIDDVELRGIVRVWFDSGDIGADGPRMSHRNATRVHVDFLAADLFAFGTADVDSLEVRPAKVPA